jgi:hypothetical protein
MLQRNYMSLRTKNNTVDINFKINWEWSVIYMMV